MLKEKMVVNWGEAASGYPGQVLCLLKHAHVPSVELNPLLIFLSEKLRVSRNELPIRPCPYPTVRWILRKFAPSFIILFHYLQANPGSHGASVLCSVLGPS